MQKSKLKYTQKKDGSKYSWNVVQMKLHDKGITVSVRDNVYMGTKNENENDM